MAVKVPRYSLRLLSSIPSVRSVTPVPHSKGIEMDHEASNEQFITQAATAPSVGLSPRWVQYSGISTEARAIAELLADNVLYVQGDHAGGELDREYLAYHADLGRADKVKKHLDELIEIGFLTIFDGGVDPETGRRRQRRDASGAPLPARYVISLEPPAGYVGPRNATEARAQFIVDRDQAYRAAEKTGRKPRAGRVTIRRSEVGRLHTEGPVRAVGAEPAPATELRPSRTSVSRGDVAAALRTVGWNSAKAVPSPKDFAELVDLAHKALTRYDATLEQVRWYAARKIRESRSNPVAYVLTAFREHAAEIAREPDPTEVQTFEDDPELLAAYQPVHGSRLGPSRSDGDAKPDTSPEESAAPRVEHRLDACGVCRSEPGERFPSARTVTNAEGREEPCPRCFGGQSQ